MLADGNDHGTSKCWVRTSASVVVCSAFAVASFAQAAFAQPSMEQLLARIDALQRRLDQLEGQAKKKPKATAKSAPAASPAVDKSAEAEAPVSQVFAKVPGLAAPEAMGQAFEDALRSDLPGLALRIPWTQTEVRVYGFGKLTGYRDINARNQTDAPSPQTIPLAGSPAARQGGDFGMSARFSRIGVDTRTLTRLGTFETRVEGDFGGGAPTSTNHTFRLRQAWAELGAERFRVLAGQANSLWNEGMFETLNDSTNVNQSFVRQPQLRLTSLLAPGLTGQVSLEAPDTQFTSALGVATPGAPLGGGLSPAFNSTPDALARLTYRYDGMELSARALLRQLSIRTAGTNLPLPATTRNAAGWGFAGNARLPMRWLSEWFGADQLIAMGYYGKGIGRYFGGNTFGQDGLSNMGLTPAIAGYSLDPVTSYGVTGAYRRFWTEQLRSNFAYSYARQQYPTYALGFIPGAPPAMSLNSNLQQAIVNLIWSPFAEYRDGVINPGAVDVGIEFIHTWRGLYGGAPAAYGIGAGYGVANRVMAGAIGRF